MHMNAVARWLVLWLCPVLLFSCQLPNYHLIHPKHVPAHVHTWSEVVIQEPVLIHLEWAKPAGPGPFPTVLVHPDRGSTAMHMRGVIWDLACHGYLAVAVDYRRRVRDHYQLTLLPWRERGDSTRALKLIRTHPLVDSHRVATLGFSQGGILSLLLAASAPDIKAVVAYYPVTDLARWLATWRSNIFRRLAYPFIRWQFRRQFGPRPETELSAFLRQASPLHQAETLRAPVLLIHGDRDGAVSIEESRRLMARLEALDREVEFMEIAGGRHVFNFKHPVAATHAWQASLHWLDRHLDLPRSSPRSACRTSLYDSVNPGTDWVAHDIP